MSRIDRQVESEVLAGELARALQENPGTDSWKFVASIMSLAGGGLAEPVVAIAGGLLSEVIGARHERELREKLQLLLHIARNVDARLNEHEARLVELKDSGRLFALKVVFETGGTISIAESHGASSVTDNGVLDFTINFTERIWPYTFSFFGSGQVEVLKAEPTEYSLRFQLAEGAPERIAVVVLHG